VAVAVSEEHNETRRKLGPPRTPEELQARAQANSREWLEALKNVPGVDYSDLTVNQAREALYRAVLEADAAWQTRYARNRARILAQS
jgi:hypothetical protein